jgi:hypothetical protein
VTAGVVTVSATRCVVGDAASGFFIPLQTVLKPNRNGNSMARRRMISQEIISDEEFNSLSVEAQLLFIRMLAVSDDCGVVPASEYTLACLVNPPVAIKTNLKMFLGEIVDTNLGSIVSFNDKLFFIFKQDSFNRFQSYIFNKRFRSEYLKISAKEFDAINWTENKGQKPYEVHMVTNCDHMVVNGSRKQQVESRKQKVESRKKGGKPESIEVLKTYLKEIGIEAETDKFFDYYETNGWVQGRQGKPIKDWKAAARNWKRNMRSYGNRSNGADISKYPTLSKR